MVLSIIYKSLRIYMIYGTEHHKWKVISDGHWVEKHTLVEAAPTPCLSVDCRIENIYGGKSKIENIWWKRKYAQKKLWKVTHPILALPCQKFPGKNLPPETCWLESRSNTRHSFWLLCLLEMWVKSIMIERCGRIEIEIEDLSQFLTIMIDDMLTNRNRNRRS